MCPRSAISRVRDYRRGQTGGAGPLFYPPSSSAAMPKISSAEPTATKCPAPSTGCHTDSRHSVSDRLVDGIRDQPIVQPLPHVDAALDRRNVEGPTPIKEFAVANEPAGTMGEAFRRCRAQGGFETGPTKDLLVVLTEGVAQLLEVGAREAFGGDAERRIHQPEGRRETQREGSAHSVGLRQLIRRPVVAECPVTATRDAGDVAQSDGIDVGGRGKRPRAALRPARHTELLVSQAVGDGHQIVCPAGVAAR